MVVGVRGGRLTVGALWAGFETWEIDLPLSRHDGRMNTEMNIGRTVDALANACDEIVKLRAHVAELELALNIVGGGAPLRVRTGSRTV